MSKSKKQIHIDRQWCKGCGICVAFCPKGVLLLDEEGIAKWAYPEKCIRCFLCEMRCPDIAIEIV